MYNRFGSFVLFLYIFYSRCAFVPFRFEILNEEEEEEIKLIV